MVQPALPRRAGTQARDRRPPWTYPMHQRCGLTPTQEITTCDMVRRKTKEKRVGHELCRACEPPPTQTELSQVQEMPCVGMQRSMREDCSAFALLPHARRSFGSQRNTSIHARHGAGDGRPDGGCAVRSTYPSERVAYQAALQVVPTMIMQRVIFRHFPIFTVLSSGHFVWTTLNPVSCFLVFPRSRLKRQLQCVAFPCWSRHVSLVISAESHVVLSLT